MNTNRHHLVKICVLEELHWLYNCDPLVTVSDLGAVRQILEISLKCSSLTSPTCIEKEAYRVFIHCTNAHSISKRTDHTNICPRFQAYRIGILGILYSHGRHIQAHVDVFTQNMPWVGVEQCVDVIFGPAFLFLGPKWWMGGRGYTRNPAPISLCFCSGSPTTNKITFLPSFLPSDGINTTHTMGVQQPKINLKYLYKLYFWQLQ